MIRINYSFVNKLLFRLNLSSNFLSNFYCHFVHDFDKLPGPRPSLPLIGTSWQYFKYGRYDLSKLHEANLDKFDRFGRILKEEFEWRKPVVHLIKPEDFEIVFRNQGIYPNRPVNEFVCHYRKNNKCKYANVGLSNLNGKEWFEQKKKISPVLLKLTSSDAFLPQLNQICDDLVYYVQTIEELNKNNKIQFNDLQSITYRLTLESICMLCLDARLGCLSKNSILEDGLLLIDVTKKLFDSYNELYYSPPIWKIIQTKSYKKFAESESTIYQIIDKYIEIASNKTNSKNSSLLKTLLEIQNLDERDARTLIIDFISGGINTISNSLAFILYHLAQNSQVQSKLLNEFKNVVGHINEPINNKHLSQLKYLKACVKEGFRLNSTIPCLVRKLPEEVVLSNYKIPASTIIFSHFYATCHSKEYFENPLQYLPERWIDSNKKNIHPFSLLPFGFGTKMCAGRRFSETLLYLAITKIISNYELYPITRSIDLKHSFILIPKNSIKIAIKKRVS